MAARPPPKTLIRPHAPDRARVNLGADLSAFRAGEL
jgi:hypothetical protein